MQVQDVYNSFELKLSCTVRPITDLETFRWNFVDDASVDWIKRHHRRQGPGKSKHISEKKHTQNQIEP